MALTPFTNIKNNFFKVAKSLLVVAASLMLSHYAAAQIATQATPPVVTAQNYQLLTLKQAPKDLHVTPGKIHVIEFFSYGCPWCYKLDPSLQAWVAKKPANVEFERIPVSFEPGWDLYQKVYYIAVEAKAENKLHSKIFSLAQNPILGINSPEQAQSFFANNGINAATYNAIANGAKVKADIVRGKALMQAFGIMEIPTIIVTDGKKFYMINNRLVNANNDLFIATLNYLVKQTPF